METLELRTHGDIRRLQVFLELFGLVSSVISQWAIRVSKRTEETERPSSDFLATGLSPCNYSFLLFRPFFPSTLKRTWSLSVCANSCGTANTSSYPKTPSITHSHKCTAQYQLGPAWLCLQNAGIKDMHHHRSLASLRFNEKCLSFKL